MAAQCRSFFDDVKKELECCVCQEQFDEVNEPKVLKCLHTFCKSCLEHWLRQQGGSRLRCPTCRQITECPNNNINSLPSNLFYKQMVGIVEAYRGKGREDSPHCGNCEQRRSLKFYCSDCNCFLCEECSMAHKKLKVLRGHHVKEIGYFVSSDTQDYARKLSVCKEHEHQVRFYCQQCVTYICRDCAILEHRDHNFVSIDKGLERKRSEIETKMGSVLANGSKLREEKEFLKAQKIRVNKSIEKAKDEVHRVAERNIALIRQHESSVTEQLIRQKDAFEAKFSNALFQLVENLTDIETGLEFGNDILGRNNLPEILNMEELLEQRFQELSKPSDVNTKLNYSEVIYVPNDLLFLKNSQGKLLITKTVPSLSLAEGTGLTEGTQGSDCDFIVITKDLHGNNTHSEIDEVFVDIKSTQTGTSLKVNITDSKDGCYKVSYKPETAGDFIVSVIVAGEAVKGSPFQL
ncbi:E3 ubiquitin-protein ligase TRIM71-like [Stylophora pistillata]|nr:E3 ubiquitin-protein ligase TRIM71-like [Stylophora pistillata]